MVFEFLRRNKKEETDEGKVLTNTRIEAPKEEGIGHRVYRTTHIIGHSAKKEEAKPHGLGNGNGNGNGNGKTKNGIGTGIPRDLDMSKVTADDKALLPPLPEGCLSVAAAASLPEHRIHIFHWPSMVYMGYDVKGSERYYEGKYLIMYYLPEMKSGFSNKLTIDAPAKNEVQVVYGNQY